MQSTLQLSIDTKLIIKRMEETKEGDVVSYEELSALIGRDVRVLAKGSTRTARKNLLKQQIYFECISNVGFRRCNDKEKVAGGGLFIRKARRAAKRGVLVTTSVTNYDTMSREDQQQHNAQLSLLGAMRAISTPQKQKAIAAKVEQAQESLSLAGTLKAIKDYEKANEKPKRKEVNGVAGTSI